MWLVPENNRKTNSKANLSYWLRESSLFLKL